jgi:hypothetical protein
MEAAFQWMAVDSAAKVSNDEFWATMRRARLVSAIARGRRWLDEIVSSSVTDIAQIAAWQNQPIRRPILILRWPSP